LDKIKGSVKHWAFASRRKLLSNQIYLHGGESSVSPSECTVLSSYADHYAASGYPAVEIGTYTGISSVAIGMAYKKYGNVLYTIDHHKGNREHQKGERFFEEQYYDEKHDRVNTLFGLIKNLEAAGLEETVIPIISDSNTVAKKWDSLISFLFIDGDHEYDQVKRDFVNWEKFLIGNGIIFIHDADVKRKHKDGHDGPRKVFFEAVRSGYTPLRMESSLALLGKGTPEAFHMPDSVIEEALKYED
jgi:MMP 1-O-methyltransferase